MISAIDETELARLEELAISADLIPINEDELVCLYIDGIDEHRQSYIAAACNAVPALVAEVRRLREKVEALEWWDEVRQYTLFNHHPLWWADGHRTPEGNRYANAEKEYDEIRKAAFDDVYRGRPC